MNGKGLEGLVWDLSFYLPLKISGGVVSYLSFMKLLHNLKTKDQGKYCNTAMCESICLLN